MLAGDDPDAVAGRWAVERVLLDRWLSAFVEAGTAQVTHRPVGDVARYRDRFLSVFMHGLRNPLAVAQMWVGLLHDSAVDRGTEGVVEVATHLQGALDELADQARDVELLTAAMLGRLSLDATWVTLGELVAALSPAPVVGGEGAGVDVLVDPTLLRRVLRDLWVAAGAGPTVPGAVEVCVEVETVPPWVEVRVVRLGEPLDPVALQVMFEPFDRDETHERVTVGLYLARALTVVHGGTIGVEQDDHRTTFHVRIPDARRATVPS
ncbi:sensor histidine kinase [Nocardioides rubriscoriae]|uniref:sensor histidine kinase n=1 Tax=Nocardioides rubriscoriae TaxID=642762 RepID=UPI0014793592|nr:ATP-binding protein [Nocardioides rubriscoriae]